MISRNMMSALVAENNKMYTPNAFNGKKNCTIDRWFPAYLLMVSGVFYEPIKFQQFLAILLPKILLIAMMGNVLINLGGCKFIQVSSSDMIEHTDNSKNTPTYFGGWGSYQVPFVPQEPISKDEAEKRQSYYVGYYDEQQLKCFEKYLDGKLNWKDEYVYWDNGKLKTRTMSKSDGTQTIQHFDRNGRIIH